MLPWHDYQISGYTVDGKQQTLVFELEWPYESEADPKRARLFFGGVECYHLEHDLGTNIVYDFCEVDLGDFLRESAAKFDEESKWGWPKFWRHNPALPSPIAETLEQAHQSLLARNVKCIKLSTSYGLSGWILATSSWHESIEA